MKIQFDTEQKTIKVEGIVNIGELIEKLELFLPEGKWKEFKLETNTIINNWTNPIIIERPVHYPWINPLNPWPSVICGTNQGDHYTSQFNVQC